MSHILLVEDHEKLLDAMRRGFETERHTVRCASTAGEGFRLALDEQPDVIILDLQLPDEDGMSLLQRLRNARCKVPVLIATARDAVKHRIEGLDVGADDYIVKPIHFGELSARVRALLRRSQSPKESRLDFDGLVVDLMDRRATRDGRDLDLTPREFDVLAYLLRHKNNLVSREMLARDVWKSETATWTNVIEVQVNHLRKKIERYGQPTLLHTVRGEGYVLGDRPC